MINENVARGVALLDRQVPDWRDRVDTDRLVMNRTYHESHGSNGCLLAQLNATGVLGNSPVVGHGYYSSALNVFLDAEGITRWTKLSTEFAIKHGFDVRSSLEVEELTAAWIEAINQN